jgi:hypothetical protein
LGGMCVRDTPEVTPSPLRPRPVVAKPAQNAVKASLGGGPETEAGPITVGYRAFANTVAVIGHTRLPREFAPAAIALNARI